MARVQGMKERVHVPLYDSFYVPAEIDSKIPSVSDVMTRDSRVMRFFVDVQNKTKLETNLQASGVLPSLNSFEARALRVVMSGLKKPAGSSEEPSDANFLSEFIYNSVTTLYVGEKVMIEMPTFWFPSGAGVSPGDGTVTNHGEPDPTATFRFAEPVMIESQQNFRVDVAFPQSVPKPVSEAKGPLHIWVVLDGYLNRDVQ